MLVDVCNSGENSGDDMSVSPPLSERRARVRQRAFLKGVVWFNHRAACVDCTIRDISEHGARVVVNSSTALIPNTVELEIPSKDQMLHSTVRWRTGNEMGVSFDQAHEESRSMSVAASDLEGRVAQLETEVDKLRRSLGRMRADLLRTVSNRDLTSA